MMPPWFALVSSRTKTPINATVGMMVATGNIAFFTSLDILANLLSISTLFIFMLVALALLVRRYCAAGVTTRANRTKLIVCLMVILGSSLVSAIMWSGGGDGWIGYTITVPIWFFGNLVLQLFVPQAKDPKLWGVPLVPWVPSVSIFINIFLMGSIDKASFIRFAIWTASLLVYYIFVGLHASYDTAKASREHQC